MPYTEMKDPSVAEDITRAFRLESPADAINLLVTFGVPRGVYRDAEGVLRAPAQELAAFSMLYGAWCRARRPETA